MTYRIYVGFAAGVLLASAAAAQPPGDGVRWTEIGADHEGDYFYDPASVERAGGMVGFRMRVLIRPEAGGQMRSLVALAEINCAEQRIAYLSFETFGADGARLQTHVPENARFDTDAIRHASPEATVYRRHCPRALVRPIPEPPRVMTVAPPPLPPVAPTPPPPPVPRADPAPTVRAQLLTPLESIVTADDYPASALRMGAEGRVQAALQVSPDGRVTGCTIVQSSGTSALDATTCRILVARARYVPARSAAGRATADSAAVAIVWQMPPDDTPPESDAPSPSPDEQP